MHDFATILIDGTVLAKVSWLIDNRAKIAELLPEYQFSDRRSSLCGWGMRFCDHLFCAYGFSEEI